MCRLCQTNKTSYMLLFAYPKIEYIDPLDSKGNYSGG